MLVTVLHADKAMLDSLKEKLIRADLPMYSTDSPYGVRLVKGSPLTRAGLQAGGVEFATSFVILSNPSSQPEHPLMRPLEHRHTSEVDD